MVSLNDFYDQIELLFYKYGLFSSRHSVSMICFSAVMILSCCYPLIDLPIPGREPQQFLSAIEDLQETSNIGSSGDNISLDIPLWFSSQNQTAFIQQFIVKVTTDASTKKKLASNNAYKASLDYVFPLLDEIKTYSVEKNVSVANDCFSVSHAVIKTKQGIQSLFADNGCLLISPAAYWKNQRELFVNDANIEKTIDQYESTAIKAPPSIKELLFGLPSKQVKTKTNSFVVSFAITLVLKKYNLKLIQALESRLHKLYSPPDLRSSQENCQVEVHSKKGVVCTNVSKTVTHIWYYSQMSFNDLTLLLASYFGIGCYIYFSVKKINFVKSKLGMALCAVVSVLATLMVAVGLCSLIGLTPTLTGGQTFPYLVCFVGLENILVITKSVVTTHTHLDVEKRMAVGLCREGCSIVKNLLLEFFILGLGFFNIFVPAIKEFCAFAIVGICSDFFINMTFFIPVLSIDIKRLDNEDLYDSTSDESDCSDVDAVNPHLSISIKKRNRISRKHSTVKRKRVDSVEDGGRSQLLKIPRRLRLVFFFADTRMIQRGLMVFMIFWFSFLVYRDPAGILTDQQSSNRDQSYKVSQNLDAISSSENIDSVDANSITWGSRDIFSFHYLSFRHWPTLFSYYNVTLAKRYISILPSVLISIKLPQSSIKNLDKIEGTQTKSLFHMEILNFRLPKPAHYEITGFDYYVTLVIGAVSGIFMLLLLNAMYHCICSSNYANSPSDSCHASSTISSVPLLLSGHSQMVDCVHVEGVTVVSADITGELRIWDSHSGECTSVISRKLADSQSNQAHISKYNTQNKKDQDRFGPVWNLVTSGPYIYVGCADGQLEVWDMVSGIEKCKHISSNGGIVGLGYEDGRVVAARVTGTLDFFDVEDNFIRSGTSKELSTDFLQDSVSDVNLQLVHTVKHAHQLSISAFEMRVSQVLTGSCDHTIKLFNLKDAKCQLCMFGHNGPITVLYLEKQAPFHALSGSTDGTVRLWDLNSGNCAQILKGHQASIAAAQCSMHYVVSTAQDDTLCMWERKNGTLLHTKNLKFVSCNALSLFGEDLCVTGGKGDLVLWKIKNGDLLHRIPLMNGSLIQPTVKQIYLSCDFSIVCVLGHELIVARFPVVLEKN